MSARNDAKMERLEEITKTVAEKGGENTGLAGFAMGMQSLMAIQMYEDKLDEKLGDMVMLLNTIGESGFVNAEGIPLTDTLTFINLKNRLAASEE